MNKILYLPLDERPCNYKFPNKLISSTNKYELIIPSINILGYKKIPSNFQNIRKFLLDNCCNVTSAVISLDQLLYGGIVPSRIHELSLDELLSRLNVIKEMKALNKDLKIHAFLLIMRCPKYSSSDEEPDYYELVGKEINEYGVLLDTKKSINEELNKLVEPYIDDYITRRKKNKTVILKVLTEYYHEFETLVIPQDDSAVHGFTMMDKLEIFDVIKQNNLNVLIYPGADEVGMTLLTRCINQEEKSFKKIYLDYLYDESVNLIPAYENKPLDETIKAQIASSGNVYTNNVNDADIVLVLNYDEKIELEASNAKCAKINCTKFLEQYKRIINYKNKDLVVCLIDKFFVNGGSIDYLKYLFKQVNWMVLDGYSGWNTSSNSLGTGIMEATVASYFGRTKGIEKFIVERLLDDATYQSYVRLYLTNNVIASFGCNYFDTSKQNEVIENLTKEEIIKIAKVNYPFIFTKYQLVKVSLPWKRMFEVDVEVMECEK